MNFKLLNGNKQENIVLILNVVKDIITQATRKDKMQKEYNCVIKIEWSGNNHEAENKEDYIKKVKDQFYEEYGIDLADTEITEVEED
tara:strand:- start:4910 stop:5170 length:261 start_codon:yes stop_codon:yes gene_type:complete